MPGAAAGQRARVQFSGLNAARMNPAARISRLRKT